MRYIAAAIVIPCMILFCSLRAYAQPTATTMPVVKIGAIYSLSGYEAPLGKKALQGSETAVDWVNHHGGVNGHPIQLIVKNSKTQATVAEKVAKSLLVFENLKYIFKSCR
ncbi:MAG: ABC transporter substrate-binding protein [Gammaproteobacteria bacterium]|nr:ABC transporter substrate-binding protein [Gammaproteobacteria bacterium]